MIIVSIDIGIEHLGLIAATLRSNYTIEHIIHCELVDLTRPCNNNSCSLPHSNTITDRMIHFFAEHEELLGRAEHILIERQIPISGLVAIQSLIHFKYRSKSTLMAPNSMHAHFGIGYLDYEGRKGATIQLAWESLSDQKEFTFNIKKDDLADAWCYLKMFSDRKHKEYEEHRQKEEWKQRNQKFITNINAYRYTPEVDALSEAVKGMDI